MKTKLPIFLVFFFGLVFLIQGFVPHHYSNQLLLRANEWLRIIAGFGLFLGIYSLTYHNVIKIRRQAPQWQYNLITLLALYFTATVGFAIYFFTSATAADDQNYLFQQMYTNILVPLEATMFSLLAFYIASAAARAFRARNVEATLLLITAVIVMLGKVSIGSLIAVDLSFIGIDSTIALPDIADWILNGPNNAARRAILIGVGLGGASTSLKILLGVERSYLGMR